MAVIRFGLVTAHLGEAGKGINGAFRGELRTNDGQAVMAYIKVLPSEREILVECVCAMLGRHVGLPIPEPLLAFVPDQLGGPALAFASANVGHSSVGEYAVRIGDAAVIERLRAWSYAIPAACFDEWIANCDRHEDNLLHDGKSEFWLIDHGYAAQSDVFSADQLVIVNKLFSVLVMGQGEPQLLKMRPVALDAMQRYASEIVCAVTQYLPENIWSEQMREELNGWLADRQSHLMRFATLRLPAQQGALL